LPRPWDPPGLSVTQNPRRWLKAVNGAFWREREQRAALRQGRGEQGFLADYFKEGRGQAGHAARPQRFDELGRGGVRVQTVALAMTEVEIAPETRGEFPLRGAMLIVVLVLAG